MLAKSILALTVVVAIALQFVPVERTNPLGAGGPNVSELVPGAIQQSGDGPHDAVNDELWIHVKLRRDRGSFEQTKPLIKAAHLDVGATQIDANQKTTHAGLSPGPPSPSR